jgi:hypothetical protein
MTVHSLGTLNVSQCGTVLAHLVVSRGDVPRHPPWIESTMKNFSQSWIPILTALAALALGSGCAAETADEANAEDELASSKESSFVTSNNTKGVFTFKGATGGAKRAISLSLKNGTKTATLQCTVEGKSAPDFSSVCWTSDDKC